MGSQTAESGRIMIITLTVIVAALGGFVLGTRLAYRRGVAVGKDATIADLRRIWHEQHPKPQ